MKNGNLSKFRKGVKSENNLQFSPIFTENNLQLSLLFTRSYLLPQKFSNFNAAHFHIQDIFIYIFFFNTAQGALSHIIVSIHTRFFAHALYIICNVLVCVVLHPSLMLRIFTLKELNWFSRNFVGEHQV